MEKIKMLQYNKKFIMEFYENAIFNKKGYFKYFSTKNLIISLILMSCFHSLFIFYFEELRLLFIPYVIFIVLLFSLMHLFLLTKHQIYTINQNKIEILEKIKNLDLDNQILENFFKENLNLEDYGYSKLSQHLDNMFIKNK